MDLTSQELFPSLSNKKAQAVPIWKKSDLPGLELTSEGSVERLDIPRENLAKKTLGPSVSDLCKSIMARRKVSIELSSNKRTGMVTLIIHGAANDVLASKRELLSQLTVHKSKTVQIPISAKSAVIGKGGATLKKITARTLTTITFLKDGDESRFSELTIVGDEQGVQMAYDDVMEIVKKQISNHRARVNVERSLVQFLIPKVSEIETQYQVKVHIPPPQNQKELKNEDILIVGEMDNVCSAIEELNVIIKDLSQSISTIAVPLKKAQHKLILGKKGKGKQDIFDTTGCIVIIPDISDANETVTIKGPEHLLTVALQAVLEKANSVLIGNVDCRALMGLGGSQLSCYFRYLFSREISAIKEIQAIYSINIIRHASAPNMLEIHGHTRKELDEGITALKSLLMCHSKSLYPKIVHISSQLHPYIIGKRGQNINRLKKLPEINGRLVDLLILSDEKSDEIGLILSRIPYDAPSEREASDKEAEKIVDMMTKLIVDYAQTASCIRTEQLFVESRFHGKLIGSGGSMMKEILGPFLNSVKIHIGSSNPISASKSGPSLENVISVSGNMDSVQKVCEIIQGLVDQWKKVEKLISYCKKLAVASELLELMFPGWDGSLGELNHVSFGWVLREIRERVANTPALNDAVKRDIDKIYANRNLNLRLVFETGNLAIYGPKIIVDLAEDIIRAKMADESEMRTIEFSLFDQQYFSETIDLDISKSRKVLGRLIGKEGRNIKALAEKYKVSLRIPNSHSLDFEPETTGDMDLVIRHIGLVIVKGLEVDVEAIKTALLKLAMKEISSSFTLEFDVPSDTVALLQDHKDLNKLKRNHSINIEIIENVNGASIRLEGEKCNCETVKSLILKDIDEMINQIKFEVKIPNYLHKHLIGPGGEIIKKILTKLRRTGNVRIDFPKQLSGGASDIVKIVCHKKIAEEIKSQIDKTLDTFLFRGIKELHVSSLHISGFENFVTIGEKDFENICAKNGQRLIDLTRKFETCIFMDKCEDGSATLRLWGKDITLVQQLKDYLLGEKEVTTYLQMPAALMKADFERSPSEFHFLVQLTSKLGRELKASFDIDPAKLNSGKIMVKLVSKKLPQLEMAFKNSEEYPFISHIHVPSEVVRHIIGKGGERLRKLQSACAAKIDIDNDSHHDPRLVIICGQSRESIEKAKLELGNFLKNNTATMENVDQKVEKGNIDSHASFRSNVPPGYSFSQIKLRFDSNIRQFADNESPKLFGFADSNSLNSSLNSTICEDMGWKTIKGGKVTEGQNNPSQTKKKKKKKPKANAVSDLIAV